MRYLCEIPCENCLFNLISEQLWIFCVRTAQSESLLYQNLLQLFRNVTGLLHGAQLDKVFIAPIRTHVVHFNHVKYIEECQVIATWMHELRPRVICCLLLVFGALETLRHWEHCNDYYHFIGTLILRRADYAFGELRLERIGGHHLTSLGQLTLVIYGAQAVQELKCAHQRFRSGRVHTKR